MIGFCCATPYHLLLTLHMSTHEFLNDEKCLVVFNHFANVDEIVRKVVDTNIFKEVVLVNNQKSGKSKKWLRRAHFFCLYNGIKTICNKYCFEKFIFFMIDPMILAPTIKRIIHKNPSCEICLGEDGIGSYINPCIYKPKKSNYKANYLLQLTGWKYWLDQIKFHYVLHPELIVYNSDLKLRRITPLQLDDKLFYKLLVYIWGDYTINERKIMFLQQPLKEGGLNDLEKVQVNFLNLFSRSSNSQYIAIKLHPRTSARTYAKEFSIVKPEVMYELAVRNMRETQMLVSVVSTALFTPFLLWNITTPIVLLYKLCNNNGEVIPRYMERFIYLFSQHFIQLGGKIFIPKNESELVEIFKNFNVTLVN